MNVFFSFSKAYNLTTHYFKISNLDRKTPQSKSESWSNHFFCVTWKSGLGYEVLAENSNEKRERSRAIYFCDIAVCFHRSAIEQERIQCHFISMPINS